MKRTMSGFTIVELLIVIVVIAILAAISTIAYRGIQNRAYDTTVEADIANAIKKLELFKATEGHYPRNRAEFPGGFKFSKAAYDDGTTNNIYYLADLENDRYGLGLRSKSGRGYIINTGTVVSGVTTVRGNIVASHLGITWVNSPTSYFIDGYSGSSSTWNSNWSWTSAN